MEEDVEAVVIGAGQAGLAVSHELGAAGTEHVVLERSRIGATWTGRWDSFCLVTPNHTIRLPGGAYEGDDPHGYLPKAGVVKHLERYAESFAAPVRTGVEVLSARHEPAGGWRVETTGGTLLSRAVVVATGAYQTAYEPPAVPDLRVWLPVVPATEYRNPTALPDGAVLVLGSGQSGCQIAEELVLSGRRVVMSCGRAPWIERRLAGRDAFDWALDAGVLDQRREDLPSAEALLLANLQATGRNGGHDLHYRTLAGLGVEMAGHVAAAADRTVTFRDDLADSVAFGDAARQELWATVCASLRARGEAVPDLPAPSPWTQRGLASVQASELGAVVLASGYRPGYSETILHPEAFDSVGFPLQDDGASTVLPGLFFVGVHFMRTRKSALLVGVGEDAAVVARQVTARLAG